MAAVRVCDCERFGGEDNDAMTRRIACKRPVILPVPHVPRRTILIQGGVGIVIFVVAALTQGYDLSWDVLNYHFYNGFAALHGKVWSNIQAAMQQSYLSPLLDIPFYLLVVTYPRHWWQLFWQ